MSARSIARRSALPRGFAPIGAALAALLALLAALAPPGAAAQAAERCFPETGYCISGRIREFWEQNGGLPVFGLPLGPPRQEQIEGKPIQAQWFERTRLELHPENQRPYDVLLGRIGVDVLERQGRDWYGFPKSEAKTGCRFFPETGHNVCGRIWRAWQSSGLEFDGRRGTSFAESLALFGLPLSDEQTETIEGRQYTVQWFERARFELHPENKAPYDVLLGRLGAEALAPITQYVLPGANVFPESVAYRALTGELFVSSTADGTIFHGATGQAALQPFLPGGNDGRTTAIGVKVDDRRGRLYVAGGSTKFMWVYDTGTGNLIARLGSARQQTFINDAAITPGGDAYFTDSVNPVLYRVPADALGELPAQEWLDLAGTPIQYQQGFNLNGIVSTSDGKYLIAVQSNTGKLFRIDIASRQVVEVNLGGQALTNGDGMLIEGRTLYVVRNQNALIVKIQLSEDFASGSVLSTTTDPALAYPTGIAKVGDQLLVVNSQFDKRGQQPTLPFTVARIPSP